MATFTITSAADTANDASIGTVDVNGNSSGTLREAINFANQNVAAPTALTTIVVSSTLAGQTVTLAGNLPLVATSINFDGGAGSTTGQALTINGGGTYRGLLISGIAGDGQNASPTTVGVSNVTFANTVATGGAGMNGGGGGLGAGGALFIGPAANVTLTNVGFSGAEAVGGAGGADTTGILGGGGGLGGAGGTTIGASIGGGGGGILFNGGNSTGGHGTLYSGGGGGGGITGAGGSTNTTTGGIGGAGIGGLGGGGGGGGSNGNGSAQASAMGGGTGAGAGGSGSPGGSGGFGGGGGAGGGSGGFGAGGGGGNGRFAGSGGFGGGGGGAESAGLGNVGGLGGFGGGGGEGAGQIFNFYGGAGGGFSGGEGSSGTGGGGGGGALGGAVFVSAGGSLTINGSTIATGGGVTAGAPGSVTPGAISRSSPTAGTAFDAGIFFEGAPGGGTSTLTFGAGNQSFNDAIGDLNGASGNTTTANGLGGTGGIVALVKSGAGTLTLSGVDSYSGGTTLVSGTLDLGAASAAGTGAITYAAIGTASLALESGAQAIGGTFGNTLTGFNAAGETLDLKGFTFNPIDFAYFSNGTSLTVMGGTGVTQRETFTLTNGAVLYTAQRDAAGTGTLVTAVCFVTGTRIATARGEIAVEALQVGDLAVTASGGLRPVGWIGHRYLDGRDRPISHEQQPVRIRAGAFGRDSCGAALPRRDLLLSPGHPVLVGADADGEGGHLVPAMCLVNGTTVERVPVESITYWHVELDAHDILLAEGLPAESYLDWGDRAFFSDAPAHALANPDFVVPGLAGRCRPVALDGPVVEAERRRLDAVFATTLAAQCGWDEMDDVSLAAA